MAGDPVLRPRGRPPGAAAGTVPASRMLPLRPVPRKARGIHVPAVPPASTGRNAPNVVRKIQCPIDPIRARYPVAGRRHRLGKGIPLSPQQLPRW